MIISFSPQVRFGDNPLVMSVDGNQLSINDETFDFAALPDGFKLPPSAFSSDLIIGASRAGLTVYVTIALPVTPSEYRESVLFPDSVSVPSGPVPTPLEA